MVANKIGPKLLIQTLTGLLTIALASLFFFMFRPATGQETKPDLTMTILHTNDLHAHDESFVEHGVTIGGLARIGQLIRTIRQRTPNTVVVDAGDIFQGTPLFTLYHGAVEVHLLSAIGYDFYTIGNHEFDEGPTNLAEQLSQAKFQVLSSNLDCSNFPPLAKIVAPSAIKIVGGEKVGFVGAITPELSELAMNLAPVKLKASGSDWLQPIKAEVDNLKENGVNKIIVISHSGVEREKEIAQAIPDVDVIVGGHSHTRLDAPVIFEHPGLGTTMVVQTGCYGRALGCLHLAFDKEGRLIFPNTTYRLINITGRLPQAPDLKAYIDSKVQPLLALRSEVLGQAQTNFEKDWLTTPWDSALGDLISDAIYESGKKYGAQISFENRGGIRGRIEKGPVTEELVEELLPFDNRLTVATISGTALLNILEHSVSTTLGGKFLDVHGLKFAYTKKGEPGHRIVFALSQNPEGTWQPIKPEQNYRVAINSYSFSGGEGYDFKSAKDTQAFTDKIASSFRSYLKDHPALQAQPPSRIIPVEEDLIHLSGNSKQDYRNCALHLQNVTPGSMVELFVGKSIGVEAIEDERGHFLPVPLTAPKLVAKIAVKSGEYSWHLPLTKEGAQANFASVVVFPPKDRLNHKVEISSPLSINQ